MEVQKDNNHQIITSHKSAVYFLHITRDKLNADEMKKLKCLLFHLISQGIVTETLTIEVYFVGEGADALQHDYEFITKLLFNGYNLVNK